MPEQINQNQAVLDAAARRRSSQQPIVLKGASQGGVAVQPDTIVGGNQTTPKPSDVNKTQPKGADLAGQTVTLNDGTQHTLQGASQGNQPINTQQPTQPTNNQTTPTFLQDASPTEPTTITEAVEQTYKEKASSQLNADMLESSQFYEELYGTKAPYYDTKTYVEWRQKQGKDDLAYFDEQAAIARESESANLEKAKEQARGAVSANKAMTAQSREGAMSATNPLFTKEFAQQVDKQMAQISREVQAAELQRQKTRGDLEMAIQSGQEGLAKALQDQLGSIENNLRNLDTQALQVATQANDQALKMMQFQHNQTMDVQTNFRSNFETFGSLVDQGIQLNPEQIKSFSDQMNIPFELAFGYYTGQERIRTNNSMDDEQKAVATADLTRDFQLKVQGVVGEKAQQVYGILDAVKTGKMSESEAEQMMMGMGIEGSYNPITRLNLQLSQADLIGKKIGLKYMDREYQQKLTMGDQQIDSNDLDLMIKSAEAQNAPAREVAELKLLKAQVEMAEMEKNEFATQYENKIPVDVAKGIFTLSGPTRITESSFAGQDGKKQCGEAYNDFTEGARVGSDYYGSGGKMAAVTKRDKPEVGNGLVLPLTDRNGELTTGHIETVIAVNPVTGVIQTVSYNRDGNGSQTFETYSVDELNSKYKENWGFTSSTLKPKYADQVGKVSVGSKVAPEYNWASTIIDNTFGDAEGGKAAARKNEQLATAIKSGDGKAAKNIVYNAVLEGVTGTERTGFEEALTLDDSYSKLGQAIDAFEKSGYETGLLGNTISEIQKKLTAERATEVIALKTRLDQSFNAYRKAITGAGASVSELDMLKDSMPTFEKNFNEIKNMAGIIQGDAKDLLDRKVDLLSKGAFSSYDDMQSQLGNLERLGGPSAEEKRVQGFLDLGMSMILDHYNDTGQYIVTEESPSITYEF